MAGAPTSSRNRKIITASLRLCLGGKFCLNKFSAVLTASQNASVPLADDGSVLAGVDFDIYTFADLAPMTDPGQFDILVFDVLRDGVVVGRITQKTADLDEHASSRLSQG